MTTKSELIAQLKAENPTMTATVNGEEMQLNKADYELACSNWAEMRLAQIAQEEATAKIEADKAAAQSKLAALGLTADDLKALRL